MIMDGNDLGEFLDLLYAAAVDPQLWVPAMERLADMVGGTNTWLSRVNVADGSGTGITARIDPVMPQKYTAYFAIRNPFANRPHPVRYIRAWTPKIRFHEDFLPRETIARTEFYNDFLQPQDIHASMMIGLAADGLETSVLNVNRPIDGFNAAHVELAGRLHPHLRRAFDLSRKLGGGIAGGETMMVLDALEHAVFLIDTVGRITHANEAARALAATGSGLRIDRGILYAVDRKTSRQLDAAICLATASDTERRAGGSVSIAQPGGKDLVALVTPVRGNAAGIFGGAPLAMVAVSDPAVARDVLAARNQVSYGLTTAETRVAMALLDGQSPREAAARLGVSFQTVRNQLQALYEKTHTNRQSALVLMLSRSGG
ncbi:helix-turn-helix transcriptional regulator [Sphingosinicellaceae bacterium]|nr:helix-turn-helix transcriptional regulator [Sphingosinicellaceae bacterium]